MCILKESVSRRLGLKWIQDSLSIIGFGVNAETVILGKAVLNLKIDEANLDNVDVYIVPDSSHPLELIIGPSWCEAPKISYVKYENTITYYNTVSFPYPTESSENGEPLADRLMTCEGKQIEAKKITMITAVVSGEKVQVPVRNPTDFPIEVQAIALLARRAAVVRTSQSIPELLYRPLTYNDIKRPESLTVAQQAELLDILNEYRTYFALFMEELVCTDKGIMDITLKPGSVPYTAKPY